MLKAARARAEEVGVAPIGTGGGAALRFLCSVIEARAVVEIGTGTGISGVWMMRGMRPDGVLTSVDLEAEHQRLAKQAFTEAGFPSQRVRLIPGAALDVLPRLTDGHYDLVFADGDKTEYPEYLAEALRLLKPGGVVAFDNALWHDRVADPAQRDEETVAIRELGKTGPRARLAAAGPATRRRRPARCQEDLAPHPSTPRRRVLRPRTRRGVAFCGPGCAEASRSAGRDAPRRRVLRAGSAPRRRVLRSGSAPRRRVLRAGSAPRRRVLRSPARRPSPHGEPPLPMARSPPRFTRTSQHLLIWRCS